MDVVALYAADFLVDVGRCVVHDTYAIFIYIPGVVLGLFRYFFCCVDEELVVIAPCVNQFFYTSVAYWVHVVWANDLSVTSVVAYPARKAFVKVTARISQVRVNHLEPSHVDIVLLLFWWVEFELDLEVNVTRQLLYCGVGHCEPETRRIIFCASFGYHVHCFREIARPDILQSLIDLV